MEKEKRVEALLRKLNGEPPVCARCGAKAHKAAPVWVELGLALDHEWICAVLDCDNYRLNETGQGVPPPVAR